MIRFMIYIGFLYKTNFKHFWAEEKSNFFPADLSSDKYKKKMLYTFFFRLWSYNLLKLCESFWITVYTAFIVSLFSMAISLKLLQKSDILTEFVLLRDSEQDSVFKTIWQFLSYLKKFDIFDVFIDFIWYNI